MLTGSRADDEQYGELVMVVRIGIDEGGGKRGYGGGHIEGVY